MQASKHILVTGADGFIGSHLVEELVSLGFKVKAFVLYNSFGTWGWLDSLDLAVKNKIEVCMGDIRDSQAVRNAVKGCDIIYHLAALIAIPYSYVAPDSYIETNIRGTLNILNASRDCGVKRLVHTSTSEVYGTAQYVPIDEKHPLHAQSPYAASKIGADQMALSFYRSFGTPVTVIRPFNTYGPRQSARAVIPTIITQLAAGKRKIKLGSCHPTRDFSYVKDIVKGFVAISSCDAALGEVVNVGSNFEISIQHLVDVIAESMGVSVELEVDQARVRPVESEVDRLWADTRLAHTLFGWVPRYQGIEGLRKGLSETIVWFQKKEHLSLYKENLYNV